MSKLTVTQQLRLQTKLTPAQIQVIKLLELPSCDLQQRINEELQENPALEEGRDPEEVQAEKYEENDFYEEDDYSNPLQNDDFNYDAYVNDDETPDYVARNQNYSADQSSDEIQFAGSTSFSEYLKQQIYLTKMTKPQRHIAKWVLGNIDEDGFLRRTTEQLVDDLAFQEGLTVSDAEMEDIVNQIKEFDPVGVASYDLQECLLKQLKSWRNVFSHAVLMLSLDTASITSKRNSMLMTTRSKLQSMRYCILTKSRRILLPVTPMRAK